MLTKLHHERKKKEMPKTKTSSCRVAGAGFCNVLSNLSAHATALRTRAAADEGCAAEASVPKAGLSKVHDALSIARHTKFAKLLP